MNNKLESFIIDPQTTIGAVTLAVANLDKMLQFYQQVIGLAILNRSETSAELGIENTPLVILEERPEGKPFPRSTGLYHMAILLPSRPDLGHWLNHLIENRYPLSGAGDHIVSEALYLSDPEGNGIEIYRDRPREQWEETENGIRMDTLPVDLESLQSDAPNKDFNGLPSGTTMGHIHLKVNDVNSAVNFYRDVMGFNLMATLPAAAFLSAGGYHHHVGANMWNSRGAAPPPPGSLGLISYQILFAGEEARNNVLKRLDAMNYPVEQLNANPFMRDPAGNGICLQIKNNR
jgi:catechol 2,3-dioxygenase